MIIGWWFLSDSKFLSKYVLVFIIQEIMFSGLLSKPVT